MLEFRFLGPVEVVVDGRPVSPGPPKRVAVLAALLVDAGRPVSVDTLVDRVWGDDPPPRARAALYSHVTRIRKLVATAAPASSGSAEVARGSGGYVLRVDHDAVDAFRAQRLANQARDSRAGPEERAAMLHEALGLWRGEPLSGVTGAWAEHRRQMLTDRRIAMLTLWAELEFKLGRHDVVVEKASALLADNPLAEPVIAVLMRALFLSGRATEALERYAAARARFADELGTEPGHILRQLHEAILQGSLGSNSPEPQARRGGSVRVRPAQLPLDIVGFVGRADELASLDRIAAILDTQPGSVAICVVSGMAGVGKTVLAVHWAQRAASRFPDGQLYVNLRGFDAAGAVAPAEAIRDFLDAFEVPSRRIPLTLQAQVNLYRSLMANKRALVVLDNARDADQVRQLLPGAPGCMVLITSRNRLTGLVVAEGARSLDLGLLTNAEARLLLSRRVDDGRITAEPAAVSEIIVRCAWLPLALAIAGARIATQTGLPLQTLLTDLRQAKNALAIFSGDDTATDVRAILSWSYATLSPSAASLFRLLALHPGPEIGVHAAASLAGVGMAEVETAFAELTMANLLAVQTPGRYSFHDLLRAYAAELTGEHDADEYRAVATRRMLDHYLHTAYACDRSLSPLRDRITIPPAHPGTTTETVTTYAASMEWFTTERPVVLACIKHAAATGYDDHAIWLAWSTVTFFDRRGHWQDWITTQHTALACAQRIASAAGQANAHRVLGRAYIYVDRPGEAKAHLDAALAKYDAADDDVGKAYTHLNLTILMGQQDRQPDALHHAEEAFAIFRRRRHRIGEALALNAAGWSHAQLGNHLKALQWCERALILHQQVGNRNNEAVTWDSLGYIHHRLGNVPEAVTCYHRALQIYDEFGSLYLRSETLVRLGDVHYDGGHRHAAHTAWRQALRILEDLGHSDAGPLRARLLDRTAPRSALPRHAGPGYSQDRRVRLDSPD